MRHPAVQDCAVLGKPDTVHGELPMALVVLKHGVHVYPEDLQQFMKGRMCGREGVRREDRSQCVVCQHIL